MQKKRCIPHEIRNLWVILTAIFLLGVATQVSAQVDQGSITGVITDSSGSAISGASVTLVNQETGLSFSRTTGASGYYTFSPIKIGTYTLTASAPSFETLKQENIHLNVSQTVGLNLSLKPGVVNDTITVTSTPELQTEEASTGQVFTAKTIDDTPLNGRNYVFIAQLTTGVAAPNQGFRQVAGSGDFTSNGNRVSQNNFVLDGVDNNSNMQDFLNGATYAVRPPPDALAEFKVESSDYSAELGRSTGASINASIKSGTNSFHGSLWEYFQSDRLDAANYAFSESEAGKTAFHQNLFGATLGGPIWKDKLFFFADAQATLTSSFVAASANNTVPTDLERNGDFSDLLDSNLTNGNGSIGLYLPGGNSTPGQSQAESAGVTQRYLTCNGVRNVICPSSVDPVAQRILKLFPEPNQGVPGQTFQNYTIPATASTNNVTQYDARVDFNPSQKDQLFGRYSYSNNPVDNAPPFPILDGGSYGSTGQNTNYGKSGVFSETHFFSPTLSNEFRVGFNWLSASYLQDNSNVNLSAQYGLGGIPFGPSLGGFPAISFSAGSRPGVNGIGVPAYLPSSERQNVLQIIDNVSKVWGNQTVKAGINFQHIRFYGLQPPNGIGSQSFTGLYTSDPGQPKAVTGSGIADFLLNDMNSSTLNTVTPFTDLRWYYSAFVQDDWKVTPRLTLNLGIRWEYTQPQRELQNHQANFFGNYAPNNQGTGTYLIPRSQQSFPIAPALLQAFANDHINLQYTSNDYLVNPQQLNFAPRIGLSFAADDRTVFRAGAGFFYGGLENIGLGLNLANNAPFYVQANFIPQPDICQNINNAITCPTNGQTLETGFGAAANSAAALADASVVGTIYANDQNAETAYTAAYNLSMQHSLSSSMSFTIGYQGNQSKRLRMSYDANNYNAPVPFQTPNPQDLQPFHDFSIVNVANQGVGRYDSLQAKIDKQYSHGFYFLVGYTWAHCLDDAFGPIGQAEQGGYRNPTALGFRYDYGACTQDVRNRFTFSPQYDLPFGRGKRFLNHGGVVDEVVGGWKSSFVFQAQSGNPIFLTSSNQSSSYPIKVSNPFGRGGIVDSAAQVNFVCATKTRTLQQWFNPCAFKNPPQAASITDPSNNLISASSAGLIPFGPPGRVDVVGPGFNKLDMSLFKSFAIPVYASSLQFRADAFNLLNHPSFGNPGSSLTGASGQAITSSRFSGIIPSARVIQLALRLTF